MKTVPLGGLKAAGRVALVDDADYDLVMQYRWHLWEIEHPGRRTVGPYARMSLQVNRVRIRLGMHNLILGITGIDHINHDGLDNQRANLRPATGSQNQGNKRPQAGGTSIYKGVFWNRHQNAWRATIKINGRPKGLGDYASELQAAYAYDAAAHEVFGDYACPNFPEGPSQFLKDQWRSEREAHEAAVAERMRAIGAAVGALWEQRVPETRTCVGCGGEYQSRSTRSFYCGMTCRNRAGEQQRRERGGRRRKVSPQLDG